MGDLTMSGNMRVQNSQVTGQLPSEIGLMARLRNMNLAYNALTGTLPTSLGSLTELTTFVTLLNFPLSGTIPSEIGLITSLKTLLLAYTGLTGTIPSELGSMTSLSLLLVPSTSLTGPVPEELCFLRREELTSFRVDCGEVSCSCCADTCPGQILGPLECAEGESSVQVKIGTGQTPEHISWSIMDVDTPDNILLEGGPYAESDPFSWKYNLTCMSNDLCAVFQFDSEFSDEYLDYHIDVNGNMIFKGSDSSDLVGVGQCAPSSSPSVSIAPTPKP